MNIPKNISHFFSLFPLLVIVIIFVGIPTIQAIYYGFIHLDIAVPDPLNYQFVYLTNFFDLFLREDILQSFINSVVIGISATFGILGLALVVALIANSTFKGRSIYRAIIILPWAISNAVAAQQFKYMLLPTISPIGFMLNYLGLIPNIESFNPLSTPATAVISVVGTTIWKNAPFVSIILLAGMQSIPDSYYEAAKVDGANSWNIFRRITFPLLLPFINIGMLFSAIVAGTLVDIVYTLTQGGPGITTQNLPFLLYKIYFHYWNFGVGGALSIFLLIYSFILLIPLIRNLVKYVMGL